MVLVNGERAGDVTTHPAYRRAVESVGKLYDFSCAPENQDLMTFVAPDSGERANRIYELPRSYEELVRRRKAIEAMNETHGGFLGRGPDHVGSCIAGMYMGLEVFEAYDKTRAGALSDYYKYARDNDLYLTYVIVNPQADRSKSAAQQKTQDLVAGVVDRDKEGITIRGAKMLATGGIMANEVFVACIQPLQPGDERFAFSCAIPMNSKGLKLVSRKSYEQASPSVFDNPLASRYDENDAVLYFDDVKVPWDRVFIVDDIDMSRKQFFDCPTHSYQNYQAMIRLSVKMRFLAGIGRRIAETNGVINFPAVRENLGMLAAEAVMVDSLVAAMEAKGYERNGYFLPNINTVYSAQSLTQYLYPKVMTTLRELAGGGMIMLPSSIKDYTNPEIADLLEKTQQSPVASAEDRVKFFKLAWDAVGSEFASRHTQYELFYAGATFVVKGHSYRTYNWDRAAELVDRQLNSYSLADELAQLKAAE